MTVGAGSLEVKSWDDAWTTHPRASLRPRNIDEVVAAMRDHERYPAPVRPHGTGHSPADCRGADGGTVVDMLGMSRILEIGADTITVEAGALYIDTAKALEARGLQHYVNTEIGCLTVGSAACCATKDASMPGEFGQISSYVVGMKIVTAAGEVVSITEETLRSCFRSPARATACSGSSARSPSGCARSSVWPWSTRRTRSATSSRSCPSSWPATPR